MNCVVLQYDYNLFILWLSLTMNPREASATLWYATLKICYLIGLWDSIIHLPLLVQNWLIYVSFFLIGRKVKGAVGGHSYKTGWEQRGAENEWKRYVCVCDWVSDRPLKTKITDLYQIIWMVWKSHVTWVTDSFKHHKSNLK